MPAKKKLTPQQLKFLDLLEWAKKLDPANHQLSMNLFGEHETFARKTWWRLNRYISRVADGVFVPKGGLIIYYKPPKTMLTIISGFVVTDFYKWKILDPEIIVQHHKLKRGQVWVNPADVYPTCPIRRTNLAANETV